MYKSSLHHSVLIRDSNSLCPKKANLIPTLMLTSLIDAFAILVIYLLMNFGDHTEIQNYSGQIHLPTSRTFEQAPSGLLVEIKENKYFCNKEEVSLSKLVKLLSEKNSGAVIIASPKHSRFSEVNQVVLAASQAGISHITFVTTREPK